MGKMDKEREIIREMDEMVAAVEKAATDYYSRLTEPMIGIWEKKERALAENIAKLGDAAPKELVSEYYETKQMYAALCIGYEVTLRGMASIGFPKGWIGLEDYKREWQKVWKEEGTEGVLSKFVEDVCIPLWEQGRPWECMSYNITGNEALLDRCARLREDLMMKEFVDVDKELENIYNKVKRSQMQEQEEIHKIVEGTELIENEDEEKEEETLEGLFGVNGAKVVRRLEQMGWIEVKDEDGDIGLRWLREGRVVTKGKNAGKKATETKAWAFFCYELVWWNHETRWHGPEPSWAELTRRFGVTDKDKLRNLLERYTRDGVILKGEELKTWTGEVKDDLQKIKNIFSEVNIGVVDGGGGR